MQTSILLNGDMVITIPKEEKEQQLRHLDSLLPADKAQFDEITELMNIVNGSDSGLSTSKKGIVNRTKGVDILSIPYLKLVKG